MYTLKFLIDVVLECFIFLSSNKSSTLPVETDFNITAVGLSPDGTLLIAANEGWY